MTLNPNYPNSELGWGPLYNANAGSIPTDKFVSLTGRTLGTISTARGRQYELDQVQAGTLAASLSDNDGALDVTNSAGPWAGSIAPYQPMRLRMQYPTTPNLLMPGQASGGEGYPAGAIPAELGILSTCDPSGGQIVSSGTAYQGSNVFQFAVGAGFSSGSTVGWTRTVTGKPGQTYTMQARVRNLTAGTSQGVKARISYYDKTGSSVNNYGSAVTLVGSTSAAWSTVQFTYTLPAGAYGMQTGVSVSATSVACTIQMDGWQIEEGSTASAWTLPGTWYPIYAGFVERWPTAWRDAGSYGIVSPTAVDAFALLSQRDIRDPLSQEIYSRSPRFSYPLSDPQGSTSFADQAGLCGPMGSGVSRLGPGTLAVGTSVTATDTVNGVWAASGATVATLTNSSPGTATSAPATFLTMPPGVNGPAAGSWTRGIAFRYTGPKPTGTNVVALWTAGDQTFNPLGGLVSGTGFQIQITSTGRINFTIQRGGTGYSVPVSGSSADIDVTGGNWHMVLVGYKTDGSMMVSVDGNTYSLSGPATSWTISGPGVVESVGAWPNQTAGGATAYNFSGDLAYLTEFPSFLSSSACSAIYQAWKTAFLGDSTDQRYARILGWAGYTGATDIASGQTRSMSAAKGGSDALSMLQAVVETENGNHWVSPSGAVTFRGRASRYNSLTPVYTFGERVDLGEYPYEEITLDYDSTHLANAVEVTQAATGQKFAASDATSQAAYFPRTMSRTVDSTDATEVQAAAGYLVSRYKDPKVRVTALKLHPAGTPSLWPVCLALEIGTRIRVMRRAGAAPAVQLDCFVEHVQWDLDDQGEAFLTLQCSPVDPTPYGLFSALHATVGGAATAGSGQFTLAAPTGGTAPILAGSLPIGSTLVIGSGGTQETVTVRTVATTSAGWATATVGINGTLAYSHAVGESVYVTLPTGYTDPAFWDSAAVFDSVAFSY